MQMEVILLERVGRTGHEEPGAAPRDECAMRHQPVVRLHHREGADAVCLGQRPDRRHAHACMQCLALQSALHLAHDLVDEGFGLGAVQGKGEGLDHGVLAVANTV